MTLEITTTSDKKTREFGERLGRMITSNMTIALSGGLGSGKTTFVQGVATGLGVPDNYYVTSPTYTIINDYPGRLPLFHIDLYRLASADDLEAIGFDEIIDSDGVIMIEWPGLIGKKLLTFDLSIDFHTIDHLYRKISLNASGLDAANLINRLSV